MSVECLEFFQLKQLCGFLVVKDALVREQQTTFNFLAFHLHQAADARGTGCLLQHMSKEGWVPSAGPVMYTNAGSAALPCDAHEHTHDTQHR